MGICALVMIVILIFTSIVIGTTALAVCLLLMIMFGSLTVAVDNRAIEIEFGIGWIHREIPLENVDSAEVIKTRWFYGWGIRLTPKGWMWNTSGFDAVQLNYQNGKHFIIGSDDATALAETINQAKMG
jgi:hypothetical protein